MAGSTSLFDLAWRFATLAENDTPLPAPPQRKLLREVTALATRAEQSGDPQVLLEALKVLAAMLPLLPRQERVPEVRDAFRMVGELIGSRLPESGDAFSLHLLAHPGDVTGACAAVSTTLRAAANADPEQVAFLAFESGEDSMTLAGDLEEVGRTFEAQGLPAREVARSRQRTRDSLMLRTHESDGDGLLPPDTALELLSPLLVFATRSDPEARRLAADIAARIEAPAPAVERLVTAITEWDYDEVPGAPLFEFSAALMELVEATPDEQAAQVLAFADLVGRMDDLLDYADDFLSGRDMTDVIAFTPTTEAARQWDAVRLAEIESSRGMRDTVLPLPLLRCLAQISQMVLVTDPQRVPLGEVATHSQTAAWHEAALLAQRAHDGGLPKAKAWLTWFLQHPELCGNDPMVPLRVFRDSVANELSSVSTDTPASALAGVLGGIRLSPPGRPATPATPRTAPPASGAPGDNPGRNRS